MRIEKTSLEDKPALGAYSGLRVIESNHIPTKIVKIPVEWRTFRERWFTLPWKPKELFRYIDEEVEQALIVDGKIFCNHIAYKHFVQAPNTLLLKMDISK
jgi:hypothetical protein